MAPILCIAIPPVNEKLLQCTKNLLRRKVKLIYQEA